jgi:integrase/recombinase XerD
MTGRVVECPIDEMNRQRGRKDAKLRILRTEVEVEVATLFTGWSGELVTCRKFAPVARNYTVAKVMAEVGLRVNEARRLDLADIKWAARRWRDRRHHRPPHGSGAVPCRSRRPA